MTVQRPVQKNTARKYITKSVIEKRGKRWKVDDDTLYEPEGIFGKRTRNGKTEYLLKWKDWGSEYNTWESLCNVRAASVKLIEDFERMRLAKGRARRRPRGKRARTVSFKKGQTTKKPVRSSRSSFAKNDDIVDMSNRRKVVARGKPNKRHVEQRGHHQPESTSESIQSFTDHQNSVPAYEEESQTPLESPASFYDPQDSARTYEEESQTTLESPAIFCDPLDSTLAYTEESQRTLDESIEGSPNHHWNSVEEYESDSHSTLASSIDESCQTFEDESERMSESLDNTRTVSEDESDRSVEADEDDSEKLGGYDSKWKVERIFGGNPSGELKFLIKRRNVERPEVVRNADLRKYAPQELIEFYEQHTIFPEVYTRKSTDRIHLVSRNLFIC